MKDISLRIARHAAAIAVLTAATAGLTGCNTMVGIGKDIESIGHNVSLQAHHWSSELMDEDSPEGY